MPDSHGVRYLPGLLSLLIYLFYEIYSVALCTQKAKVDRPTIGRCLDQLGRPLCRHMYRPAVVSANRHVVATMVGKRWLNNVIGKLIVGPLQGMLACPIMGQRSILVRFILLYIGSLLGAQSGPRATQRLANGWSNNVIVDLTVGPLHRTQHCDYLLLL